MSDDGFAKVPKFLRRLFRETSDPLNDNIVWSEDGTRLRIVDKDAFIRKTLPSLSKTKEYSAFIRQLNIYGFVKMRNEKSDDSEEYYNCFFKQGQPNLMAFMKRVTKMSKSETQLNWPSLENSISYLSSSNYRLSNEIAALKERVDKQDRTIDGLLDILGKVFRAGVHNIKMDSSYAQQSVDSLFKYSLGLPLARQSDVEPVVEEEAKGLLARHPESDKASDNGILPDMNDIFF